MACRYADYKIFVRFYNSVKSANEYSLSTIAAKCGRIDILEFILQKIIGSFEENHSLNHYALLAFDNGLYVTFKHIRSLSPNENYGAVFEMSIIKDNFEIFELLYNDYKEYAWTALMGAKDFDKYAEFIEKKNKPDRLRLLKLFKYACDAMKTNIIKYYFKKNLVDDEMREIVVHKAYKNNNLKLLKTLHQLGVDIFHEQSIIDMIELNRIEIIEYLISAGQDISKIIIDYGQLNSILVDGGDEMLNLLMRALGPYPRV